MKILVVDDEPLARQRLEQILSEVEQVETTVLASNGQQAIEICQNETLDVVLLDIRMPGIDGLETAQHLSQLEKTPAIIFTTAYDEYALDAFDVNAIAYLLKPVRKQKLVDALNRASQFNQAQIQSIKEQPQSRKNITAKISGNIKLIPVEDIFYFQADQKYVTVKHVNGETIIEDTLKDLQTEFELQFMRVHRNALVARKYITGIHKDSSGHSFITFNQCDSLIEISRRHLSEVKKTIKNL